MALTLPKWLPQTFSITEQMQLTDDAPIEDKTPQKASINQKNSSQQTPSLSYLDEYIHQWF